MSGPTAMARPAGAVAHEAPAESVAPVPALDFSGAPWLPPQEAAPGGESAPDAEAIVARLAQLSFGERGLLLPTEQEGWRAAVETIRRAHQIAGRPKRRRVLFCAGAAPPPALSADADVATLETADPDAILAQIDPRAAALVLAPVSMRDGLDVLPGTLLAALRGAADEYGVALVFDETPCGPGRSGMAWAHEWTGVTPDLMIVGQGLAGAQPLAALVMSAKFARGLPARRPALEAAALACAQATLEALLSPGFEERVQNRGWRLEDGLAAAAHAHRDLVNGICGLGLMQGLICAGEAEPLRAHLAGRGLATRAIGRTLVLLPPLTAGESEIETALALLAESLCSLRASEAQG